MTNIIMLVRDRYRLTKQCINSLYNSTPQSEFNLTIIDDETEDFRTHALLWQLGKTNATILRIGHSRHILSHARNLGVYWAQSYFGRGDRLYFTDNDIYFRQNWLAGMNWLADMFNEDVKIIGGCRHPFHGVNVVVHHYQDQARYPDAALELTDAVAGYSMLMDWDTWDNFGPFEQIAAPGVGQSEDFAFSRRVVDAGLFVGYTAQPVVYHCGITNSDGKPAVGAESFERVPGLIYE